MEKTEKEFKKTVYVAFDGTEFENERECVQYEKSEVSALLSGLPCVGYGTDDFVLNTDHKHYLFIPRTRHDIFTVNRVLEICGSEDRITSGEMYMPMMLNVLVIDRFGMAASLTHLDKWMRGLSGGKFAIVSLVKESEEKEDVKTIRK